MFVPPKAHIRRAGRILDRTIAALTAFLALGVLAVAPAWPAGSRVARTRIALVTIVRPDDDRTVIEDAVSGLRLARREFGDRVTATWLPLRAHSSSVETANQEWPAMIGALTAAARSSDVVIAWGDLLTDAVLAVAPAYPRANFILEDPIYLEQAPANVTQSFVWDGERAFLAGAVAAMRTRSRRVGYLGSTWPGWQSNAFRAGAYYVNPVVEVIVDYVAKTVTAVGGRATLPASWRIAGDAGTSEPGNHSPDKADEVALAQFDRGADVIYAAAGASNDGAYEAARRRHGWVIESGGPRSLERLPDAARSRNLALITERTDVIVYHLISHILAGRPMRPATVWKMGDLPPGAIGVAITANTPERDADARRLDRIARDLRDGLIDVPYSAEELAAFVKRYAR